MNKLQIGLSETQMMMKMRLCSLWSLLCSCGWAALWLPPPAAENFRILSVPWWSWTLVGFSDSCMCHARIRWWCFLAPKAYRLGVRAKVAGEKHMHFCALWERCEESLSYDFHVFTFAENAGFVKGPSHGNGCQRFQPCNARSLRGTSCSTSRARHKISPANDNHFAYLIIFSHTCPGGMFMHIVDRPLASRMVFR